MTWLTWLTPTLGATFLACVAIARELYRIHPGLAALFLVLMALSVWKHFRGYYPEEDDG